MKIKNKMILSIIIPAYNEQSTITEILTRVKKSRLGKGVEREIIVIDDASTDKTYKIIKKVPGITTLHHKKNKGFTGAMKTSLYSAKKNLVFLAPGDGQFNFDQFDLVISVTSEAAKGIITKPKTKHICYCLTPTRYLWSGYEEYFKNPIFTPAIPP